jgi:predicted O-linked N-acetylglucosamine transferase (SPINDLY family)
VFGSFNCLFKVTNDVLDLWGRVLASVPRSKLLLKSRGLAWPRVRERVFARLEAAGIERDRVTLHPPVPGMSEHLGAYGEIDVALDTFPYGGTTTTCEALWMGVPVVTLAGDRHAARVGNSLLHAAGLDELVARTKDDYVSIAVRVAGDAALRTRWRASLRDRVRESRLGDAPALARSLEEAYRRMWRAWLA